MMRVLAVGMVVLPLLVGGGAPCPEPNEPAMEDCPFAFDSHLIVGQYLGWVCVEAGQQLVHTRTWCDPDGDTASTELLDAPEGMRLYNKAKMNSYTLVWTPKRAGVFAAVVRVTDQPRSGEPAGSTGTILVQVVAPARRAAPGLCGGPPR